MTDLGNLLLSLKIVAIAIETGIQLDFMAMHYFNTLVLN